MSRKKLKPVTLQLMLGNNKYKQTVYGKHIRFAFLPGHLFVLHDGVGIDEFGFSLTHVESGFSVAYSLDYGCCLAIAKDRLLKSIKTEPFNHLVRRVKRYKRK